MPLTVLYFAAARERAGLARELVPWEEGPRTAGALVAWVVERHPALKTLVPYLRVAVDQVLAEPEAPLKDGAEIALLPPVSGGSAGRFEIVGRPLVLQEVVNAVTAPGRGAVATFSGAVRAETGGRRVLQLEYEAYLPMAQAVLTQLGAEVAARWPGAQLAVLHRVGTLVPGDLAVVLAVGAPHRAEAFQACAFAIDALKQRAPIWKRERFEDGEVWVGLGP